jgi:hypothetical protein
MDEFKKYIKQLFCFHKYKLLCTWADQDEYQCNKCGKLKHSIHGS